MNDGDALPMPVDVRPECECGYRCQGDTIEERVGDAQRHAREAHGIEVTSQQVLANQVKEGTLK